MTEPRVLYYDIETAPSLGYVWRKWQTDVIDFESDWYIMCVAWQFEGDKKPTVMALPDTKEYRKDPEDDRGLVSALWRLFDEADVVVAHNGDHFDQKKTRARMLIHGFDPPSPFQSIDTLKAARRTFSFTSNRLGDLGQTLGLGAKVETGGFGLWRGCMQGDEKAWKQMRRYNVQDVTLLRDVYLKLRPWMVTHPNMALLSGRLETCPRCGSQRLSKRGLKFTKTGTFQQWRCAHCGGYSRSRLSDPGEKPERVA